MAVRLSPKEVDEGIEATIFAIREKLMEYFKGDCVQPVTTGNIQLRQVNPPVNHNYERREREMTALAHIDMGGQNLLLLRSHPNEVNFFDITLDRSKVMKRVRSGIELCLERYLPNVEIGHLPIGESYWRNDKQLVVSNSPRSREGIPSLSETVRILQNEWLIDSVNV